MTTIREFETAVHAARGATPITARQRAALECPPPGYRIDPLTAAHADRYVGQGDVYVFVAHVLRTHDARLATVKRTIAAIRNKEFLGAADAQKIVLDVAALSEVPATLREALDLADTASPRIAADALERALQRNAAKARREGPVVTLNCMEPGQ